MKAAKLIFLILLFASSSAWSVEKTKSTTSLKNKKSVKAEKKKIGVDQSDFMPGANKSYNKLTC